ncbi:MAG: rhombosortase [Steroidobacteraceae bacterium]
MTSLAKSLNCDGRNGRWLLGIVMAITLAGVAAPWERAHLSYDRVPLAEGEVWRWVTAHLVHLDLSHAVLNSFGFVLVWALYRQGWRAGEWLVALLLSIIAIDAGLWFLQPHVTWYVGASGVLHGLIAAGLFAQWRTERAIAVVVAVLLCAKLAWEARAGALPFTASDAPVVLPAHLYGAVGGGIAGLTLALRRMAIMRRL